MGPVARLMFRSVTFTLALSGCAALNCRVPRHCKILLFPLRDFG
jgi:hypothetical protein